MTTIAGRTVTRDQRRQLARESARLPVTLQPVDRAIWPPNQDSRLRAVWRSRGFLVQVLDESEGIIRLTVNRTTVDTHTGRWEENITWDELQQLKRECGFGQRDAVEIYPADRDLVNVASMRHLFIQPGELAFKWKKS